MDGHRFFIAILAVAVLAGCRSAPVPAYSQYAPPVNAYAPVAGSSNAFDGYALAAMKAEYVADKYVARVTFTPGERQAAQKKLEPLMRDISLAANKRCEFEFTPHGPLEPAKYQRGWRLLGLCLCWDLQDALAAGNLERAVELTVLATTFGFDLSGGGAIDASTGLRIADDVRKAIARDLDQLSPKQLKALETGIKSALARKPPLSQTIGHEKADMLQTVQSLQQHYRDGALDEVLTAFGPDTREPLEYLKQLQPTDPKRTAFFNSLAEYASQQADYAVRLANTPVIARGKVAPPPKITGKVWHRLAKYIADAPLPLIAIEDITVARTRLLVIEAELTRRKKLHMPLPSDLSGFTAPISIDPFTGSSFIYRSNGEDYLVYSVGQDGLDDAGQTDSAFLQPDLRLERPNP